MFKKTKILLSPLVFLTPVAISFPFSLTSCGKSDGGDVDPTQLVITGSGNYQFDASQEAPFGANTDLTTNQGKTLDDGITWSIKDPANAPSGTTIGFGSVPHSSIFSVRMLLNSKSGLTNSQEFHFTVLAEKENFKTGELPITLTINFPPIVISGGPNFSPSSNSSSYTTNLASSPIPTASGLTTWTVFDAENAVPGMLITTSSNNVIFTWTWDNSFLNQTYNFTVVCVPQSSTYLGPASLTVSVSFGS